MVSASCLGSWAFALAWRGAVLVFGLWIVPMIYLFAHEGGHCITAAMLGDKHPQLFLGCSIIEGYSIDTNNTITVCPEYFYSFVLQQGYCTYTIQTDGIQSAWLAMSGSFYGFLVLAVMAGGLVWLSIVFFYRRLGFPITGMLTRIYNKLMNGSIIKKFLLWPMLAALVALLYFFRLSFLIRRIKTRKLNRVCLLITAFLFYLVNVNRLFYGFTPGSMSLIFPAFKKTQLAGDGSDAWLALLGYSKLSTVFYMNIAAYVGQLGLYLLILLRFAWSSWKLYKEEKYSKHHNNNSLQEIDDVEYQPV